MNARQRRRSRRWRQRVTDEVIGCWPAMLEQQRVLVTRQTAVTSAAVAVVGGWRYGLLWVVPEVV